MAPPRITHLTSPPIVGRFYLVPTVLYAWNGGKVGAWPVFLPKHTDEEHLNFRWPHYHVDPRFLPSREFGIAANWSRNFPDASPVAVHRGFGTAQRQPLMRLDPAGQTIPHPEPVWAPRRCARSTITYQFGERPTIKALRAHYAGKPCKHTRAGWVCPHKNFPLGSIAADAEGVITCPLHGLQIRAADGVVVGGAAARP